MEARMSAKVSVSFGVDRNNPGRFSSFYDITAFDSDTSNFESSVDFGDSEVDTFAAP
jgi:hypothetical protein